MKMRHRWKIILGLTTLLLVGVAIGSLLTLRVAGRRPHFRKDMPDWSSRALSRYESRLDLTTEQVEKLKPLFDETGSKLMAMRKQAREEMKVLFRTLHDDVSTELNLDQRVKLEEFEKERNRHHHSR